jgi:hypothetical protein
LEISTPLALASVFVIEYADAEVQLKTTPKLVDHVFEFMVTVSPTASPSVNAPLIVVAPDTLNDEAAIAPDIVPPLEEIFPGQEIAPPLEEMFPTQEIPPPEVEISAVQEIDPKLVLIFPELVLIAPAALIPASVCIAPTA